MHHTNEISDQIGAGRYHPEKKSVSALSQIKGPTLPSDRQILDVYVS